MEPKYKVNPLTGELQEYVFEYNGILALRNFTARVEDERLILHAADDVNFSILEALVSEVEINGVVYDNPTAAQEALTRLTFNQNRPVLLDKTLKDLILGAVQKVEGKGLSSNDFTNAYKQQLDALEDYDIELDESTTELKFKKGNNVVRRISLMFLDDEGTKLVYNRTGKTLELRDKRDNLLTSISVSHFVSNIPTSIVVQNGKIKLMAGSQVIDENTISYNDLADKPDLNFAPANHTHYWDDIGGKPNNLATTENVKTAIDGIQIGGRNLLLNSKNEQYKEYRGTSEVYIIYQIASGQLEPNTQYTLSLEYKSEDLRSVDLFFVANDYTQSHYKNLPNTNRLWKRETFTFTTNDKNPRGYIRIDNNGSDLGNVTSKLWTRLVKLEKGNKPTDWTPAPEDLATTEELMRKITRIGYEVGADTVIPQAQQNDTVFVKASCTLGLQNIEHLGSVSFIKTFDTGAVTFTCAGKTIIMKGDTQFNGGKGSTAVVSIHNNDCYIRISNV
nr:MAG TPA: Minor structural protein 4 [Caudoviricetes sp.]